MMPRHIELDRTFWPLGDGEEYDPDTLRAQARFGLHLMHWSNLLTMTRVVILAEAGTGKTHELLERLVDCAERAKQLSFVGSNGLQPTV